LIGLSQLPLIWAAIIAATILRSFTGFGFALAAVPVFALFLTPAQSVVLCVSLALALGIQTWPKYHHKTAFKPLLPMFAFMAAGTMLGALLPVKLNAGIFQLAIGVITTLACLILTRYHPRHREAHPALTWGTGLVSGLLNGIFAVAGPPVVIYAMATEPDAATSRAFLFMFFTLSSAVALASYGATGLVDIQSLYLFLLAYPAMYLGDKLGHRLFLRHGHRFYRRVALMTLLLIGLSATARGIFSLYEGI